MFPEFFTARAPCPPSPTPLTKLKITFTFFTIGLVLFRPIAVLSKQLYTCCVVA